MIHSCLPSRRKGGCSARVGLFGCGKGAVDLLDLLTAQRAAVARAIVRHASHELVQPLTAILNYVEVGLIQIEQSASSEDGGRPRLYEVQHHGQEAVSRIRQMRHTLDALSATDASYDVNAAVRDAVALMHPKAREHDIDIHSRVASAPAIAKGNRFELTCAVAELLRNSLEAIEAAGARQRVVMIESELNAGEGIEVRVRDAGVAVSQPTLERLFEPFFTTKGANLGLGLAVARAVVEAQGGHILARRSGDVGMTFKLRLPVENEHEQS